MSSLAKKTSTVTFQLKLSGLGVYTLKPLAAKNDSVLGELESDVEDRPHIETEPQLPQQRDNVLTVDPVPESRYNLQNKNRLNPYTFSGKVSEKWIAAPRRNRKCAHSLDYNKLECSLQCQPLLP